MEEQFDRCSEITKGCSRIKEEAIFVYPSTTPNWSSRPRTIEGVVLFVPLVSALAAPTHAALSESLPIPTLRILVSALSADVTSLSKSAREVSRGVAGIHCHDFTGVSDGTHRIGVFLAQRAEHAVGLVGAASQLPATASGTAASRLVTLPLAVEQLSRGLLRNQAEEVLLDHLSL